MSITINPALQTNALGSFQTSFNGLIQGFSYDDPVLRNELVGGILKSDQAYPIWGGVGISERIPQAVSGGQSTSRLGGNIIRATGLTGASALTGFSVFDQNIAAINSPQSPVPLTPQGGGVNLYRLGSGMRIAVAADPLLASLEGSIINSQVSWDFVAQRLVPYIGTLTISSGTYNNTTGEIVLTMSAPVAFSAGDAVVLANLTGTGAYASLNGTYITTEVSGSTVKMLAAAGVGASTITGGDLTLGSGASSAAPVKVLDLQVGNSMTVSFNPVTGFANWNRNGTCALILI